MRKPIPHSTYHLGLDLGFSRNPSALACLEDLTRPTGEFDHIYRVQKTETVLVLRAIFRLPLRTPYADIPAFLANYLERLDARTPHYRPVKHLAVDATGVGMPVVEHLQRAGLPVRLEPIVITSGESVGQLAHAVSVPRSALLHNLRVQLETQALRIPAGLPNLPDLYTELGGLGDPKAATPDDMAFALALAAWSARPHPYVGERDHALPVHLGGPKPRLF
ncbi:hypothetical protein [Paludibaculum fermentans]|uniref:DUF429 domain-containing protein n=1 Tax=Paludibaculum fermentans TaxID=1473598 RepID=A0A7S7SK92_PALFE|nr:hypothetical protein [Paludibaculum fermentans]QOY86785.1 hypothetical protein IRI77_28980 [Paludibaculum fermentans]